MNKFVHFIEGKPLTQNGNEKNKGQMQVLVNLPTPS